MALKLDNKADLGILRTLIEESLSGKATSFAGLEGLKFKAENIRFEGGGDRCTVQLKVERNDAKPKEEKDWHTYATLFGLQPEWLGQSFRRNRMEAVRIVGLMPNRRRFPVYVEDVNTARRFLLTIEEVQRKMKEAA